MTPTQEPTTTVRLPRRLVDAVRVIADASDRSISAELRVALDEYTRRMLPVAQRALEEREQTLMGATLAAAEKANAMLDPKTREAHATAKKMAPTVAKARAAHANAEKATRIRGRPAGDEEEES